jgi:hypothetical protein
VFVGRVGHGVPGVGVIRMETSNKDNCNVTTGKTYYSPWDGSDRTARSPLSSCRNYFSLMFLPNDVDVRLRVQRV